jgi:hypothetical protein
VWRGVVQVAVVFALPELKDPFVAGAERADRPELKDPFVARAERPADRRPPSPRRDDLRIRDLKDPFAISR